MSSPRLRVPKDHVRFVETIADLGPKDRERIIEAMGSMRPMLYFNDLVTELATGAGITERQAVAVVVIASSIVATREARPNAPDVTDHVIEVTLDAVSRDLDDEERDSLDTFFRTLVSQEAVFLTHKASGIVMEHQNPYRSARTFTDFTPVFSNSVEQPRAGVILHRLRIEVVDGGGGGSALFVTLDESDLSDLRRTLERALEKHNELKASIEKMGVPCLDVSERN